MTNKEYLFKLDNKRLSYALINILPKIWRKYSTAEKEVAKWLDKPYDPKSSIWKELDIASKTVISQKELEFWSKTK